MEKQLKKSDFIGKKITDIDIVYQKYFGYDNYDKPVCAISSITLEDGKKYEIVSYYDVEINEVKLK